MMIRNILILVVLTTLAALHARGEPASFEALARQNLLLMHPDNGAFAGPGWAHIRERVLASQNVLFGEDHFCNEIPRLASAIGGLDHFDNFLIELDPYSTDIIERSFALSAKKRGQFNRAYGDLFSFYALAPEYALLEQMHAGGAHLLGTEQVALFADPLVLQDWLQRTRNPAAKKLYASMIEQSQQRHAAFLQAAQRKWDTLYFLTPEFSRKLDELQALHLSEPEQQLIADLKRSVEIYQTGSHHKRIALMKHHLMQHYPQWRGKKNLFKYGANHMARGESFLIVQDTGSLVANLTEADYQTSFHLMVVGESGDIGSPFRGFAPTPVDVSDLKPVKAFMDLTAGDSWHVFDLLPLRKALERGELAIDDIDLARVIKGYDTLVLIPVLTPAAFPAVENEKGGIAAALVNG